MAKQKDEFLIWHGRKPIEKLIILTIWPVYTFGIINFVGDWLSSSFGATSNHRWIYLYVIAAILLWFIIKIVTNIDYSPKSIKVINFLVKILLIIYAIALLVLIGFVIINLRFIF